MFTRLKKLIKKVKSEQAGSAIILALIIIAALATTGIGAARLTKSNIQQTTSFEDGLKAYYAAEAGVEAALLEWRFDHDVEFWSATKARECYNAVKADPDTLDNPSCELAKMTRMVNLQGKAGENPVDITSNKFDAEGNVTNTNYKGPTNQPWYELKMYYRDPKRPFIGDYLNPSNLALNPLKVQKDFTQELRFSKNDKVGQLQMYWQAYNFDPGYVGKIMWHPIAQDGSGENSLIDLNGQPYYSDDFIKNRTLYYPMVIDNAKYSNGLSSIRIKVLVSNSTNIVKDDSGIYMSCIALDMDNNVVHIPQDSVNIEVVGHYNNTERKLTYKLSRESGTIMDIFDFGVFSQSSLRK